MSATAATAASSKSRKRAAQRKRRAAKQDAAPPIVSGAAISEKTIELDTLRLAVFSATAAMAWEGPIEAEPLAAALGYRPDATHTEFIELCMAAGRMIEAMPPLLIHFDINDTIMRFDSLSGYDTDLKADAQAFAKCVYGAVDDAGWHLKRNSPFEGGPGALTYYEFQRRRHGENKEEYYRLAADFVNGPGAALKKNFDHMRAAAKARLLLSFRVVAAIFARNAAFVFRTFGKEPGLLTDALKEIGMCDDERPVMRFEMAADPSAPEPSAGAVPPALRFVRSLDDGTAYSFGEFTSAMASPKFRRGRCAIVQESYKVWTENGKSPACGKYAQSHPDCVQVVLDDILPECWSTEGDRVATHHVNTYLACVDPAYHLRAIVRMLGELGVAA